MGPTWGPSGADRTQVGPGMAPLGFLSGAYGKFVYPQENGSMNIVQ